MLREIPGTQILSSSVGYGTGSLHRLISARSRAAMLHAAFEGGIRHFDTAPYYGHGLAEKALGEFLPVVRREVVIATKVGILASAALRGSAAALYAGKAIEKLRRAIGSSTQIARIDFANARCKEPCESSLAQSLKALKIEQVDILFLHDPQSEILSDELVHWLRSVQMRGMARVIGAAGEASMVAQIASKYRDLISVTQVNDSVERMEADILTTRGLAKQITYGYFRSGASRMQDARSRNPHGTILIGSIRRDRVQGLCLGEP